MICCAIRAVVVLTVLYANLISLTHADDDNETEWEKYHAQLYAIDGPNLGTEKTIQLMEKLHNIYLGKQDEATLKRAKRVDELLDLARIGPDKCNDEYISAIKDFLWLMIQRASLYPYVIRQRDLQYEHCRKLEARKLEEAVKDMSPEDQADTEALVKHIDNGLESRFYSAEKQNDAVAGLLAFIESHEPSIVEKVTKTNGKVSRKLVSGLIQKHVEGLCERVDHALKQTFDRYEKFDSEWEGQKRPDEFVAHWYHNKRICSFVLFHSEDLKEAAYKTIKYLDDDNSHSLRSKLKHMIGH